MEEEFEMYCKICTACGEDGCCSALYCTMNPEGMYCQSYLDELRDSYRMERLLLKEIFANEEKYKELISIILKQWSENIN